jgi:hypothetical protein
LRGAVVEADRRNSETVVAMGMAAAMAERWSAINNRYLEAAARASEVPGTYASLSKVVRLLLQSSMLGLGAFLVIRGQMTAGAMIARVDHDGTGAGSARIHNRQLEVIPPGTTERQQIVGYFGTSSR